MIWVFFCFFLQRVHLSGSTSLKFLSISEFPTNQERRRNHACFPSQKYSLFKKESGFPLLWRMGRHKTLFCDEGAPLANHVVLVSQLRQCIACSSLVGWCMCKSSQSLLLLHSWIHIKRCVVRRGLFHAWRNVVRTLFFIAMWNYYARKTMCRPFPITLLMPAVLSRWRCCFSRIAVRVLKWQRSASNRSSVVDSIVACAFKSHGFERRQRQKLRCTGITIH